MIRIMTSDGYRYLAFLRIKTGLRFMSLEDSWEFLVEYRNWLGDVVRADRLATENSLGIVTTTRGPMSVRELTLNVRHEPAPCGVNIQYRFFAPDGALVKQSVVTEVDSDKVKFRAQGDTGSDE
jgi:hypothetical protein